MRIRLFGVFLVLSLGFHLPAGWSQGMFSLPPPVQSERSRLSPNDVLKRAVNAWDGIRDCRVTLHQVQQISPGRFQPLWATLDLVKPASGTPSFLLKFYDAPLPDQVWDATASLQDASREAVKIYYAGVQKKLYTIDPARHSVTIEWLDRAGPLPEFLQIAGFLDFDVDTIQEKAYLDADVLSEKIGEVPTYRVKLTPRKKLKDIEPARLIWFDQRTYLPVRLAVESDNPVGVEFQQYRLNQNLDPDSLIPFVENPYVVDLTR